MIRPLPTLLALAITLAPLAVPAQAIWKWRDANGTLQISDQPPPPSVPEKSIVSRPGGRGETVVSPAEEPASAAAAPAAPARDAGLDKRKRELQAAEAAKQAEAKQRDQARKDDNCRRARAHLATLDSGTRVSRTNDKGEREVLDDAARAAEADRVRQQVSANCN